MGLNEDLKSLFIPHNNTQPLDDIWNVKTSIHENVIAIRDASSKAACPTNPHALITQTQSEQEGQPACKANRGNMTVTPWFYNRMTTIQQVPLAQLLSTSDG